MGNEAPDTGADVGDFVSPSKKVFKSTFRKRASLRLTESRSSVFAKLSKLSSQELSKRSEQCSALAKGIVILIWARMRLRCRPRRRMMHKVRSWCNIFSTQKLRKRRRHLFLNCVVQVPTGLWQPKTPSTFSLDLFPQPEFFEQGGRATNCETVCFARCCCFAAMRVWCPLRCSRECWF